MASFVSKVAVHETSEAQTDLQSKGTEAIKSKDQPTGRNFTYTDGASYSLGFAYDNMGHLSVVDYPDGNQAIYDYTDGAVADVRLKVGSYNVYGVTNIGYRPMDLAMSTWTSFNGLNNTIAYDSDLRPTSITVPDVESLAFAYDAANRITDITNGGSASLSQTLGYDAVSRLTSVTLGNGGGTASYAYDADGNRVSQTSTSGVVTNFAYASTSNRLASVSGGMTATYGYNADGDTKTIDGHMAYTYGPFNALVNANGTAFAISAEGQRLEKSGAADTTYFAPDASGPLLAEDLNGTWRDYVWLNGRLVEVVANGGVFSLHDDQTGRPLYLTDPNSHAVDWAAEGLPFDRDTIANRWGAFEIGFPGQYWDTEDNLWHNGNRDYDPTLGRYIESDPIGLAGGVNTYVYVGDNPISNVDPLGLYASCSCKNGVEHVNIPITFKGAGATPENIQKFTNAIENEWSTSDFVVAVTSGPQNQITIVPGNYGFAVTNACVWGTCNASGTWGGGNPGSVAAHEAGHLTGLPDMYLSNSEPSAFPGFENDIMGAWGQPVTPTDRAAVESNLGSCN